MTQYTIKIIKEIFEYYRLSSNDLSIHKELNHNFNNATLYSFLVKDGFTTNIDFVETGIETEILNSQMLEDFLIGRSAYPGNSPHAGKFSAVNIWDHALHKDQIMKWTSCK